MLDSLLARFRDPVELDDLADAADRFEEEKAEEIDAAEERAADLHGAAADALDELDAALAEFADYEHPDGRDRIDDVIGNIAADRRRMIDRLTLPETPRALRSTLDEFIEEFGEMSQKESAILEAIGDEKRPVFRALDTVRDRRDAVASFLDGDYAVLERRDELDEAVSRRDELRGERETVAAELDGIDIAARRADLDEVEEDLAAFRESDAWKGYEELQEELEAAREDERRARQRVSTAMGKMERGLKKLLYAAENGDITVDAPHDVLRDIRDGDLDAVIDRDPGSVADAVEAAVDALPDDLLGDRQASKFRDGADALRDLDDHMAAITDARERVAKLEDEVAAHDAPDRRAELEDRVAALEDAVADAADRRRELRRRRDELDGEIEAVEAEIRELLDDAFARDVKPP